jgi:hypothetical protein
MSPEMLDFSDGLSDDVISQAVKKLEKEANSSGGQSVPAIPIYEHLKNVCESDEKFAKLVNQPHKTLIKCFDCVYEQVRKNVAKGGNSTWVADEIVYNLSIDYYKLDDAEIERRKEEDRQKREAERAKKEAEKKSKSPKNEKESVSEQVSFDDGNDEIDEETEYEADDEQKIA